MYKTVALLGLSSVVLGGAPDEVMDVIATPMNPLSSDAVTCNSVKSVFQREECCDEATPTLVDYYGTIGEGIFKGSCSTLKPMYTFLKHHEDADLTWQPRLKAVMEKFLARRTKYLEDVVANGFDIDGTCTGEGSVWGNPECFVKLLWEIGDVSGAVNYLAFQAPPEVINEPWFSPSIVDFGLQYAGLMDWAMSPFYTPKRFLNNMETEAELMAEFPKGQANWQTLVLSNTMHQTIFNGITGMKNSLGHIYKDTLLQEVNYPSSKLTITDSYITTASNQMIMVTPSSTHNYRITFEHPKYTSEDLMHVKIWAWVTTPNTDSVDCSNRNGCDATASNCEYCDIDFLDWTWNTKPSANRVEMVDGRPVFIFDLNVPKGFNFLLAGEKPGAQFQTGDHRTQYDKNDKLIQKNPFVLLDATDVTSHAHVAITSAYDKNLRTALAESLPSLEFVTAGYMC